MDERQSSNSLVVAGSLNCALRLSQMTGIAPVTITKMRVNRRACMSQVIYMYGNLLAIINSLIAIWTIIAVLAVAAEEDLSNARRKDHLIKILNSILLSLVTITIAATGNKRMRRMMDYLGQIHKINLDLGAYQLRITNEKENWAYLVSITIIGFLALALDYTTFRSIAGVLKFVVYVSYIIHNIMRLTMRLQFSMIAMTVLTTFRRFNEYVKDLLQEIQIEEISKRNPVLFITRAGLKINNYTIPVSSINKIIDGMQIPKTIERKQALVEQEMTNMPPRKDIHIKLLNLAKLYDSLCNVVQDVNDSHGLILLLYVFSDFIHLIIALYSIMIYFLHPSAAFQYIDLMPILWIFYYMYGMYIVIEPCHRTHSEMSITKELIGKIQLSLNEEIVPKELEMFFNQLESNDVMYAPMDMCTLSRGLCISILSSIATYLVVVLQF